MTRCQQIEQRCKAALEREAGQRAAFPAEACAGDEALRQEVESLLAYDAPAQDLLEVSPTDLVAEMLAGESSLIVPGRVGKWGRSRKDSACWLRPWGSDAERGSVSMR